MTNQPKGIEAGIYFDLSNEDYHNDPAVSCSNVKNLLVSPMKYWRNSPLNPNRKSKETQAQKIGTALHCYLMEREKFEQDYIILPKLEIDSDFYRSESQKSDFELNFQMPKTKTAKTFKYIGGKIALTSEEFADIKEKVDYFESLETAGSLFKDGFAEVSVFWQDLETGIMCKCRFDYLTTNYAADYKSIADIKKMTYQICDYDYYIQQAYYLEGLQQFINNPKHNLNSPYKEFVNELVENNPTAFIFAFQDKEDLMVRLKTFDEECVSLGNDLFRNALNIYKDNIEKYGASMWQDNYKRNPNDPDIEMIGLGNLPLSILYKYQ